MVVAAGAREALKRQDKQINENGLYCFQAWCKKDLTSTWYLLV
jgi:hypothetical protein